MRILVNCEESGKVTAELRKLGHEAYSCDLLPTRGNPEWHIQGDAVEVAYGSPWDMMIAFPPCTHLASSGARWFKDKKAEQEEAIRFVRMLWTVDIPRVAIENPIGVLSTHLGKPSQIIQPWQFGHGETKATCLWLRGLPKLVPTDIVDGRIPRVHHESPGVKNGLTRAMRRSETYSGIAEAMAQQWAGVRDEWTEVSSSAMSAGPASTGSSI